MDIQKSLKAIENFIEKHFEEKRLDLQGLEITAIMENESWGSDVNIKFSILD